MKKRLLGFLLTLCMCVSFPLVSAAEGESATDANLQDDLSALGTLVETNSPAGAVGIAYDISSRTTRYYGISGNILADADISEPLTVPGWFPMTETAIGGTTDSTDSIIGDDNRVQVTDTTAMPYSAILYLITDCPQCRTDDRCKGGTAFMVAPNVALTAAHCVYHTHEDENTHQITYIGWSDYGVAYPGRNGYNNKPFGETEALEYVIPVQYYETQSVNYDWALILFDSNIGNSCGYFGYQFVPRSMAGISVTLTGYPGSAEKDYYQWTASGALAFISTSADYDYVINYRIDTESQQSGSPLYRYYDGAWTVVAIHTTGLTTYNRGVRFTSQMFSFVHSYCSHA